MYEPESLGVRGSETFSSPTLRLFDSIIPRFVHTFKQPYPFFARLNRFIAVTMPSVTNVTADA